MIYNMFLKEDLIVLLKAKDFNNDTQYIPIEVYRNEVESKKIIIKEIEDLRRKNDLLYDEYLDAFNELNEFKEKNEIAASDIQSAIFEINYCIESMQNLEFKMIELGGTPKHEDFDFEDMKFKSKTRDAFFKDNDLDDDEDLDDLDDFDFDDDLDLKE
ncbi:hypothetical protein [Vibrio splendidus]|uniref:hypothetical protein n=1 Tax=Vibrio splendidus TaxID=29497 RepID=UPI00076A3A4B|nr:hypothetical protein [Vibrio splendidus]PHX04345.1 hypothetical protein VSPL_41180 [Vibrio splendidus]